jgi:small subunit ribosomal protein S16
VGSKKNPVWRVVVADQRSPRDGRIIESIGHYNPQTEPSTIVIDRERLDHWIGQGARPTNTIRKLMRAPNTVAPAGKPNVPEPEAVPEPAPADAAGVSAESGTDPQAAPAEAGAPEAEPAAVEAEPAAEVEPAAEGEPADAGDAPAGEEPAPDKPEG